MQSKASANFIYGTSTRLFLNTDLGCASSCAYCYLPAIGYSIGARADQRQSIDAKTLLDLLQKDERFIPGENGTILSIGCFSECWDKRNRDETIALVIGLLPSKNPIQLATKREIRRDQLLKITESPDWNSQMHIYISSATVSHWKTHERKTTPPNQRFKSFAACSEIGVSAFLYIKPVLPDITIIDIPIYGALMEEYKVCAVIGDRFEETPTAELSPISNQLSVVEHQDVRTIREALKNFGKVYTNSSKTLSE